MSGWTPIPGETPISDISGLKIKGITTRAELSRYEFANLRKAVVKYLGGKPTWRSAPFDYAWSLRLHKQMFGQVWKWAGQRRLCDLNFGAPWQQVEPLLYDLLKDLEYWKQSGADLLRQAVMLHHRAVEIHPFNNGNGRWSRLLANIWLKLHKAGPADWPEVTIGAESVIRQEYLDALRLADDGNYVPLIDLHRRFTSSS